MRKVAEDNKKLREDMNRLRTENQSLKVPHPTCIDCVSAAIVCGDAALLE